MSAILMYAKAFLVGGAICAIGELLLVITRLTPARILVCYIIAGVVLSAVGLYGPLADFAGAGATVPLTGFGHALCRGVKHAVEESGLIGAFTGGLSSRRNCRGGLFRYSGGFPLQASCQVGL